MCSSSSSDIGLVVLFAVQYAYWAGMLVSAVLAVVVPSVRKWHRYGKLRTEATDNNDFWDSLTVPKHWFFWFYVLGAAWTLVLLLTSTRVINYAAVVSCAPQEEETLVLILVDQFTPWPMVAYLAHLLRRLWEEWGAPPSSARMHVLGLAVGGSFYWFAPLALAIGSSGPAAHADQQHQLSHNLPMCALGAFLYYEATVHQYICHGILRTRPTAASAAAAATTAASDGHYTFPRGDWFRWSSNPHYCAEILLYVSLWLVLPRNALSTRFWELAVVFTALNLCITGYRTHAWYVERFGKPYEDEHRYRVVPLVF